MASAFTPEPLVRPGASCAAPETESLNAYQALAVGQQTGGFPQVLHGNGLMRMGDTRLELVTSCVSSRQP